MALYFGNFAVELSPRETIHMAFALNVGQTIDFSIRYLDTTGVEMTTPPKADSTPSWGNLHPDIETLTASGDGLTATATGVAAGTDTIQVSLSVGGQSFTATLDGTVSGTAGQTLGSIEIVAGTPR